MKKKDDNLPIYLTLRKGKAHDTYPLDDDGNVFIDVDKNRKLIGIEVLGGYELSINGRPAITSKKKGKAKKK